MKEVGSVPSSVLGMLADLMHKLQHGSILPEELSLFLKKQNPFEINISRILEDWDGFYGKVLGIKLGDIQVPDHQPGFDRLIVIAKGLTLNQALGACKERFNSWSYIDDDDFDGAVPTNDRESSKAYAIWVRDRVEADEELKNKSANDLEEEGVLGITLLERIILELKYYQETGSHLDREKITLCSGSRCSDGCVPCCWWDGVEFCVGWCGPSVSGSSLRSRAVVSN